MNYQNDFHRDALAEKLFAQLDVPHTPTRRTPSPVPTIKLDSNGNVVHKDKHETALRSSPVSDNFTQKIETDRGPIWITRNAVMCACPNCEAPVSVRTWLMLADCWCCNVAIELSQQQRKAVEQLLRESKQNVPDDLDFQDDIDDPTQELKPAIPEPLTVSNPFQPIRGVQILRRGMNSLPAWLISFLVNLILLLILAMIFISPEEFSQSITLTTFLGQKDKEGGETDPRDDDPLQFDSDLPNAFELDDKEWREEVEKAQDDAKELLENIPEANEAKEDLKKNLTQREGPTNSFLLRDPRLRNEILQQQGGTSLTEAAVARGLRWLAEVQNQDGSWSLDNYRNHKDSDNEGDAAGTSLALLPFLGAGQTHESGKYKETVLRGIKWLLDRQKKNGDLRCDYPGESGMYIHGQATIVVVEALSMTGDEKLRPACEKAIKFIENAQHERGGWRYSPGDAGDTSVLGWQVMALQSARNSGAGIPVDRSTVKLAGLYLDQAGREYTSREYRNYRDGSLYRYAPNIKEPTNAMTAEALLCRFYLGWKRDDPRVMDGVRFIMKSLPGSEREDNDNDKYDLYYWYYGTQVMHHYGGKEWTIWNRRTRDLLFILQDKKGRYAGSWDSSKFKWGQAGGRIYTTSLAVCSLEVYYRHLPLFDRIKFDE